MQEASALLRRPGVRLLTLTGSPGIGKTRLAHTIAASLLTDFEDGVLFVPLAPIADPDLVLSTIAKTLGIPEAGTRSVLDALKEYLKEREMLLLLDNFEQVIDAASYVSDLLTCAPRLKVLITSRQFLNIYGEHEFQVPQLSLPSEDILAVEQLITYEGIALFADRALAAKRDFVLTAECALAVSEIGRRLDGLPLAIELAAARVRTLSPQELLAGLQSSLSLLSDGARDLPPRHHTLHNAIAWSYELLEPDEKGLFRGLSVFVGGCTLAAVSAVCTTEHASEGWLRERLHSLVNKNLIREGTNAAHESRFWMLETLREYGLEKLAETGELSALQEKHSTYFLELAEEVEPQLDGPDQVAWFDRLEQEQDNLRAVLRQARRSDKAEYKQLGLRLCGALHWFWFVRDHTAEGREHLTELLADAERSGPVPSMAVIAKALFSHGILAWHQGDYTSATQFHQESLAIRQELEDAPGIAMSLTRLGMVARHQGDYTEARALHNASLAMFRELGDMLGVALALDNLGSVCLDQADYTEAYSVYNESLPICRELGYKWGIIGASINLGEVARNQGDYNAARSYYHEGKIISEELGNDWMISIALHNMGLIARAQGNYDEAHSLLGESLVLERKLGHQLGVGASLIALGNVACDKANYDEARSHYGEGIAIWRDLGYKLGIAECLERLGGMEGSLGDAARAVRLMGAAEALRESINTSLSLADVADYERDVSTARAQLDTSTWEVGWSEGRAMPMEQAIAYALEVIDLAL